MRRAADTGSYIASRRRGWTLCRGAARPPADSMPILMIITSHQCEMGLIPGEAIPGFSHVRIVPDEAAVDKFKITGRRATQWRGRRSVQWLGVTVQLGARSYTFVGAEAIVTVSLEVAPGLTFSNSCNNTYNTYLPTSRGAVGWCALDMECGRLWVRIPDKELSTCTSRENALAYQRRGSMSLANQRPDMNSQKLAGQAASLPQHDISNNNWDSGGSVDRALASHHGDLDSIPGGFTPVFSHVGIVLDDAACQRVFSGYSRSPVIAFQRHSILGPHFMSYPRMTGTYGSQLESTNAGIKGRRKREIPEKIHRPAASSDTISTCENPDSSLSPLAALPGLRIPGGHAFLVQAGRPLLVHEHSLQPRLKVVPGSQLSSLPANTTSSPPSHIFNTLPSLP
ncbi:hypothetical protein PR048_021390 [Dryococelus australis]|uniref:Uncharacterized protein n=1 Tax=Dryococelus australis TaxID=614101 RepID=A0ABQ9GY48_9NEOP|nr:hypothetical protein PR048_021390 [Dryococelus australis]